MEPPFGCPQTHSCVAAGLLSPQIPVWMRAFGSFIPTNCCEVEGVELLMAWPKGPLRVEQRIPSAQGEMGEHRVRAVTYTPKHQWPQNNQL